MAFTVALGTTAFDMADAQCFSALSLSFRSLAGSVSKEPPDVGLDPGCSPSWNHFSPCKRKRVSAVMTSVRVENQNYIHWLINCYLAFVTKQADNTTNYRSEPISHICRASLWDQLAQGVVCQEGSLAAPCSWRYLTDRIPGNTEPEDGAIRLALKQKQNGDVYNWKNPRQI